MTPAPNTEQKYKSIVRFWFYSIPDADFSHFIKNDTTLSSDFNKPWLLFHQHLWQFLRVAAFLLLPAWIRQKKWIIRTLPLMNLNASTCRYRSTWCWHFPLHSPHSGNTNSTHRLLQDSFAGRADDLPRVHQHAGTFTHLISLPKTHGVNTDFPTGLWIRTSKAVGS